MMTSTTVCVSVATLLALLGSACARGDPPKKVIIGGLFPYTLEGEEFGCNRSAPHSSSTQPTKKTVF
jgi:hypothetical protein